jgi:hypothetical protein
VISLDVRNAARMWSALVPGATTVDGVLRADEPTTTRLLVLRPWRPTSSPERSTPCRLAGVPAPFRHRDEQAAVLSNLWLGIVDDSFLCS